MVVADRQELQNPFHSTSVPTILSFALGDFDEFLVNHFGDKAIGLRAELRSKLPSFTGAADKEIFASYDIKEILSNFTEFTGAELVKIINAEVSIGRIAQEMASYNLNIEMGERFNKSIYDIQRLEAIPVRSLEEEKDLANARETFDENYVKGGFTELLYSLKKEGFTLKQSLDEIASVNYRYIHTAHATTVMSSKHVEFNRDTKDRLHQTAQFQDVRDILGKYYSALFDIPLVPENKLTVRDEINDKIYHLLNHWHAIPRYYEELEKSARAVYPDEFLTEKQEEAALNAMYINCPQSSWVGGDTDGHPYVTPQETLYALKQMNEAGRKAAFESMASIKETLKNNGLSEESEANNHLDTILGYIIEDVDIKNDIYTSHTVGQDGLQVCKMNHTKMIAALEALLEDPAAKSARKDIRILKNQLRTCGNSLGYLEYRENKSILIETMDEIFSHVIPQYHADLSPEEKEVLITDMMLLLLNTDNPEFKQVHTTFLEALRAHLEELEQELESSDANSDRAEHITKVFKTVDRTALALTNSSVANDEIIAEATEPLQILGMELVKICVALKLNAEKNGKGECPYKRHIPLENIEGHEEEQFFLEFEPVLPWSQRESPLVEKKTDLNVVEQWFDRLLTNPAYQRVIDLQRYFFRYRDNETFQQLYIAMSDTVRQDGGFSGQLAIQKAYREGTRTILKYCKQASVALGGGMDSIRGGALTTRQKIDVFGRSVFTPDFSSSETSQGLQTFHTMNGKFSGPKTIENICALVGVKSFWRNKTPENIFRQELRLQIDTWMADKFMDFAGNDYRKQIFNNPTTADVLESLQYSEITAAGNRNSRPGGRKSAQAIDIQTARTITLTRVLHRNVAPAIIDIAGMREVFAEMQHTLQQEFSTPNISNNFGKMLAQINAQEIPQEEKEAKAWQMMLHGSEGFCAIIDTRAINALNTNIEYIWERLNPNTPLPSMDEIRTLAEQEESKGALDVFTAKLILDVEASCKLIYQAYTGKVMDKTITNVTDMQDIVLEECLPHYSNHVARTRAGIPLFNTISNNTDVLITRTEAHLVTEYFSYRGPHEIEDAITWHHWFNKSPDAAKLRANLKNGEQAFYRMANNIVPFELEEQRQTSTVDFAAEAANHRFAQAR